MFSTKENGMCKRGYHATFFGTRTNFIRAVAKIFGSVNRPLFPSILFLQTAFNKKGIRVNCVCPGSTDTDIYKAMEKMELTKAQQELASNTPKQRLASAFFVHRVYESVIR